MRAESEEKAKPKGAKPERPAELSARLGGVPLEGFLTTVRGPVNIELDSEAPDEVENAQFRVDKDEWVSLSRRGGVWKGDLHTEGLSDGSYELEIKAQRRGGSEEVLRAKFRVRNQQL